MTEIFAAIDWAGAATAITAGIVAIIGLRMLFKGGDLSKRVISKA